MKVKYGFKEFEIKIEDAVFKVKELDRAELTTKYSERVENNKIKFNLVGAINEFFKRSVLGWENLINAETGMLINFSDDAKDNLPFELKTEIFNEISKLSKLNDDEKKS
jgi:hypothetical protein